MPHFLLVPYCADGASLSPVALELENEAAAFDYARDLLLRDRNAQSVGVVHDGRTLGKVQRGSARASADVLAQVERSRRLIDDSLSLLERTPRGHQTRPHHQRGGRQA